MDRQTISCPLRLKCTFTSVEIIHLTLFPAVYEFILVFPSAANKYICFIF